MSTPAAAAAPTYKPSMYVRNEVNPVGSHVHNHLSFLNDKKLDAQGRPLDHPEHDHRTLRINQAELEKHVGKLTDGVQQWWDLKAQYFDTVLLFKTGESVWLRSSCKVACRYGGLAVDSPSLCITPLRMQANSTKCSTWTPTWASKSAGTAT
jgi:hypothetical protein